MTSQDDKRHRVRRIAGHYEHRIASRRPNYRILDWASADSQRARFEVLLRHLDLSGKSVLDVGCGLGDLLAFLEEHGVTADYTGLDILEKMAAAARTQHPHGRFVAGDVFAADLFAPRSFDVVFCSGAFNLNLGNNREFLPQAVRRFMELAREHVVFNLLHTRARHDDPTYYHFDPADVLDLLRPTGCDCRIIDDYLPNDFTVICKPCLGTKE